MDRISELPESLITQILSYLPIKDSVKTSALSTRWNNHYLNVPVLELKYNDFPFQDQDSTFISFLDKVLDFNPEVRLQTLRLESSSEDIDGLRDRIDSAIIRGIRHLDVKSSTYYLEEEGPYPFIDIMPISLYTCNRLVSLKLSRSGLQDPGFVVSLPCLKLMHLRKIRWVAPMTLEKLLSGCPVLEELNLLRDLDPEFEDYNAVSVVTRVRSASLKRFYVLRKRASSYGMMRRPEDVLLEIDAPGLEFMSLKEDHFDRVVVKNLTSLFTVDLDIKFVFKPGMDFKPENLSKRNEIRDFLTGITSVRHMIISQRTLKVLDIFSKVWPIPKFNNLSRLQAGFPSSSLPFLPALLESCPNLKHLILKIVYPEETEAFQAINVPRCLVSTLECVEIESFLAWKEEELKIASYFLENSSVLKKLILRFARLTFPRQGCITDSDIYEELNKLRKRCRGCRIIIDHEAL